MTEVLIERHPDERLSGEDAVAIIEGGKDCRAIHRLDWHGSLLSTDGRHMLCHLTCPDLESARIVLKNAPAQMRTEIWACTWRDEPDVTRDELGQANVLASWKFEHPLPLAELEATSGRGHASAQGGVRVLRTFIATDRKRVICLCLGRDTESVRVALRDRQPFERLFAFRQFCA
jgi:hypothetical protein